MDPKKRTIRNPYIHTFKWYFWAFFFTAFLATFKRLWQAQAPVGTCLSRYRLRQQPASSGPDRHNRLMPAHTGYGRHNTGPDSKILFLYQHFRKYSISLLLKFVSN